MFAVLVVCCAKMASCLCRGKGPGVRGGCGRCTSTPHCGEGSRPQCGPAAGSHGEWPTPERRLCRGHRSVGRLPNATCTTLLPFYLFPPWGWPAGLFALIQDRPGLSMAEEMLPDDGLLNKTLLLAFAQCICHTSQIRSNCPLQSGSTTF